MRGASVRVGTARPVDARSGGPGCPVVMARSGVRGRRSSLRGRVFGAARWSPPGRVLGAVRSSLPGRVFGLPFVTVLSGVQGFPVVTERSGEKPPQVPSGSIARIRTRWPTPASRPR